MQSVINCGLSEWGERYSIQQTSKDSSLIRVTLKLAGFEQKLIMLGIARKRD